jgi:hypothetical protein
MKFCAKIATLCVTLCLTGCFSLDTATLSMTGEEHVVVRNYGWKLFNCVPIVCSNASKDYVLPWAFFRDDVTMDKVQYRFMDYAKNKGVEISDLKYTYYDTVLFNLPIVQYPLPIPYLLCYREIQLSGNLK